MGLASTGQRQGAPPPPNPQTLGSVRKGDPASLPRITDQTGHQHHMGSPRELTTPAERDRHQRFSLVAKDVNAKTCQSRGSRPPSLRSMGTSLVPQGAHWERVTKRWTGQAPAQGVQLKGTPEQRWDHSALKWTFESTALHQFPD